MRITPLTIGIAPRPPTVLIIDDDTDTRTLLAILLGMEGYDVLVAEDGFDGLELAHAHRPDLILLDLMMPVMDGHAFRGAQRADADIRHIPVIVLSAKTGGATDAAIIGARAFIQKPIDVEELLPQIAAHIS